jgi:solute:Na+ symporter, SSS family
MNLLRFTDYLVIAGYLLVLICLGFFFRKRASKSLEDYFLGGKRLPWWAMGISGMASCTDMAGTMLIVSFLYMLGPRGLYVEFRGGAVLILAFMMICTGKWHYRSRCMTGAEWMEYRFGLNWGGKFARLISAIAVIITTVGMLAYMIKALGMFVSMFLPFSPVACAFVMIGVATLYTLVSGFYGVVFTDLFQSFIVFSAIVLVSLLAAGHIVDGSSFSALAIRVTGDSQWMESTLSWHADMPRGYEAYQNLALLAFFYFARNAFIGMSSAGADPRYFGARSERECGTMTFFWTVLMILRWPMMIGLAVMGIFLVGDLFPDQAVITQVADLIKTHIGNVPKERWTDVLSEIQNFPDHFPPALVHGIQSLLHENWQSKLHLVSYEGTVNAERIVPAIILLYAPAGARGFMLIAFVAAAFSSFNASVNKTTAYFTRDIFQRYLRPQASNRELIRSSYLFTVILVSAGFVLAYYIHSINQIWGWIIMSLGGGLAIPSLLKFYWWRYNGGGFAVGTTVGIAAAICQSFLLPGLPEWQQFSIVSAFALTGAIVGTYLSPPTDPAVLRHFYQTTRPIGFWKPLRDGLDIGQRSAVAREHRNDLLAIPCALVWQVTLFLLPMQLMIRSANDLGITAALCAASGAGLYWFWYRNLPRPETSLIVQNVEPGKL